MPLSSTLGQAWLTNHRVPPQLLLELAAEARTKARGTSLETTEDPAIRAFWRNPTTDDEHTLSAQMSHRMEAAARRGGHSANVFEIPLSVFDPDITPPFTSQIIPAAAQSFDEEFSRVKHGTKKLETVSLYVHAPTLLKIILEVHEATFRQFHARERHDYIELHVRTGGNSGEGPATQLIGFAKW